MRLIQRLSIRGKLVALSMTCTGVALVIACSVILAYDYRQAKGGLVSEWMAMTNIVGNNSTAAITFNSQDDATSTLRGLESEPELETAGIYLPSGELFARYSRSGYKEALPAKVDFRGAQFGPGVIEVCLPIILNDKEIGHVYTRSDLNELYQRMGNYLLMLLVIFAGTLVAAYALTTRLQAVISGPILNLTKVVKTVSAAKDYSVRVGSEHRSSDEVGTLVVCFDEMLAEIQQRDAELTRHREHLEEKVSARTAELQAINTELATAKHRAEQASAAKSAFLANMSHEIRTPMTAIVGYADSMLEPDQTLSDRQDALQIIRRNAQHLLELINDILDISKIEADRMTVERVPGDLPAVLSDLLSLMRPRAIAKGLSFQFEVNGAVPRTISTDPLRLRQVLLNILANAVKFTERGEIRLRVTCEREGDHSMMRFDVCDTGIGIDAEQKERLFRPFSQADESMTRRFGGTGLGLTISKRLAMLLGGDVTVESVIGKGSVFTIRVNVGTLQNVEMLYGLTEAILPKPTAVTTKTWSIKAKILLVEDGLDNQRLISMHLHRAGADMTVAENGRVGVDKAMAAQSTAPFDLILMDMQMPELDGYGAASELRNRGFKQPIIALTAHAMLEDRDKCLNAGCTDYLTKPIDKNLLLRTVAGHLQTSAVSTVSVVQTRSDDSPGSAYRSEFADDLEMKEVLNEFVVQLPDQVKRLKGLLSEKNIDELRRAVHQIKGAGGGYGFPTVTQIAAAAEARIKASDPLESIAAGVNDLIELIRNIEGYDKTKEGIAHAAANSGH
jgi:signal transduction histidine kinase/DNA-binding response OmpR family regulator